MGGVGWSIAVRVRNTPNPLWRNKKTQNPGMKVVLPQINFIKGSASTMSVTYTALLPVRFRRLLSFPVKRFAALR